MARAVTKKAAPPVYTNVQATMQRHFGIILTDEQIKKYSDLHPVTKRDSREDVCDTIDRDILIDSIVEDLLGAPWHWPINMDTPKYAEEFYQKFHDACLEKGIKLDEAKWYKD